MYDASTTAAAIVAGGRARRFGGQDKSRLVVEGRTIIVRQVEILQRVAGRIFAVGGDPQRYADIGLTTYPDAIQGAGALGGIYTALTVTPCERVVVVACDLPFLASELLQALADASKGHDGAWVRTAQGVEPLVACYCPSARERIKARIDAGQLKAADLPGVLDIVELGPAEVARFGVPDRLLANVNTPGDYARVQYGRS